MTPEERAKEAYDEITLAGEFVQSHDDPKGVIAAAIRAAVEEERAACARIVLNGGDGQDRLETAIQLGPNAAIAEAILARGT